MQKMQTTKNIMLKLPKERLPKDPIWIHIEKSGFCSHGGHGRPVTNWCNPFTGPPKFLLK
jgi:hypothetical protein